MPSDSRFSADLRTLVLARPLVTPALLDRYLAYQRALLAALAEPGSSLEEGHRRALTESDLPPREHASVAAICRAFAGKRVALRHLNQRLAEAQASGDCALTDRLRPEVSRLSADAGIAARYGAEVERWLAEREEPLVTLHECLQRAELRPPSSAG